MYYYRLETKTDPILENNPNRNNIQLRLSQFIYLIAIFAVGKQQGPLKGLATKKKDFFKLFILCFQSKTKHILFKGGFLGLGVISLVTVIQKRLNITLLVQNFCQNPFSAILRLNKKSFDGH